MKGFGRGAAGAGQANGTLPAGTADDDILIWDSATGLWVPGTYVTSSAGFLGSTLAAADPSILNYAPSAYVGGAGSVSNGFTRGPVPEVGIRLLGLIVGLHTGGVQSSTSTWTVWQNGVITTLSVSLPQALGAVDLRASTFLAVPIVVPPTVRNYIEVRVTHSGAIAANTQPSAQVIYDYVV